MSESLALVPPGKPLLDYLPVGLFGSVMGLTGLSVAWRLASWGSAPSPAGAWPHPCSQAASGTATRRIAGTPTGTAA